MKRLLLTTFLSSMTLCAADANFSGKWAMQVPGRGGQMRVLTFTLNQVGNEVTGNFAAPGRGSAGVPANTEILDGKAENNNISFYVWTGVDVPKKATYKGILSGDEIRFVITGGLSGPSDGLVRDSNPQELIARRAK